MVAGTLADRDLRALMSVIEDGRDDDPGPVLPWATLDALIALIGCDELIFNELEAHKKYQAFRQSIAIFGGGHETVHDLTDAPEDAFFWHYYWDYICSYHERTADPDPVRLRDLYSRRELANMPVHVDNPNPAKDCLTVPLPAGPGRTRKICLVRTSGPDFSDRDAVVMQLLRPHIHELYLDAERRRRGVPRLTHRECEVLQLAAGGYSNRDIADRLFISISTVRKHLEHVFDRTGCHTRAAAAAIALPQPADAGTSQRRAAGR